MRLELGDFDRERLPIEITNLSHEPDWKLRSWLPHDLEAERVVFFPDACPGKSPLPTGTASLIRTPGWRRFAVSDCGCGMRLLRTDLQTSELTRRRWEEVAYRLRLNKGWLGDLGGGNHFLIALEPYESDRLHFLVHTGSRNEAALVDKLIDQPKYFDLEFERIVDWAKSNREGVQKALEMEFGKADLLLDLAHNTFEPLEGGGAIIRKGAVHVHPGELAVIPSHMTGDVALVRATDRISDVLSSLSHGTGRAIPRSETKELAAGFDFAELRRRVLIPKSIDDASLRSEIPLAYRELDECLALVDGYVDVVERYSVIAYLGHL